MNGLRNKTPGAFPALFGAFLVAGLAAREGTAQDAERPPSRDKLLVQHVRGVFDAGQCEALIHDISGYLDGDRDIKWIIREIDSPGTAEGRIEPAEQAAKFLSDLKGVRVVAWILQDRTAGNASALLALVAQDLLLSPGARIGAIPPPPGGGRIEVPD